ncbi:MAG: hypothetical protein EXS51_00890 [Candidatus Taylorbacteria bacterium]|nr:hypothetical protein [Candidatus Taylorbacteria bacterium]
MTKYFHFTKRTFFTFLGLGIVVFVADFFIQGYWLKGLRFVGFDFQPTVLGHIASFLAYSPWVVLGIVFIVDILKRNFARSLSFFLGLALVYVSIIGYLFLVPVISDYAHRTQFDSASWKDEQLVDNWENSIRLRMVDDLLRKHELVGMSKNQVDELLGVPKPTGYFSDYDYVYWLGPKRRFVSTDDEWLGIKFKNNIIVEAKILIERT